MGRSKKLIIAVVAVAVLGWLYATPYLSVRAMYNAALERDAEGLNSRIDFPALKENLKGTFSAAMMKKAGEVGEQDPMAAAGAAFGLMMVNGLVDAMVTPEAIGMMMRGEKPTSGEVSKDAAQAERELETKMGYRDFNTFEVKARKAEDPETEAVTMIFKRHGIASWKLSGMEMPL